MDMPRRPDLSMERLVDILKALDKYEDDLFTSHKKRGVPFERWLLWLQRIVVALAVSNVATQVAVVFFSRSLPSVVLRHADTVKDMIFLSVCVGFVTMVGMMAARTLKFIIRPMRYLMPKLSDWIRIDHSLVVELVSIGGIQELTTVQATLAEEAHGVEQRRRIAFAKLGLVTIGTGLWSSFRGEGDLSASIWIAGFSFLSNVGMSIYASQLRRCASAVQQSTAVLAERTQSQLAYKPGDLAIMKSEYLKPALGSA